MTAVYGNGGAAIAWTQDRFTAQDAERNELLDKLNAETPRATGYCKRGHPLDGVRKRRGNSYRYCLTCHRDEEQERARRARRVKGEG